MWWNEVKETWLTLSVHLHKDEQMSAVSFVSVRRSLCSRCWQREHLLVNKSIFAKVAICFMALSLCLSLFLSLSVFLSSFLPSFVSFLLSSYPFTPPAWVIIVRSYCPWLTAALSASQRKPQTAALSAFSSHQPDCTATAGYITAVSGQQQVNWSCMPTKMGPHFTNWLLLALCLHVTHTPANTHPPCQRYHQGSVLTKWARSIRQCP